MTIQPIDWRAVVDEAVRRRKQDGLTQRDLAALAGVSVPTVSAFEKGEINLRFERIVAILDSLGLFKWPGQSDSLQAFVHSARRRWEELTAVLPPVDPSRQPHGHSEQYYAIDGQERPLALAELREVLAKAPGTTGWPPFWVPTRASIRPVIRDGLVECWLGKPDAERAFPDPAHSDFWQVSRAGNAYLQRGYQEDGPDLEAGTIFDVTLPIWRTGEVLLHAAWLARELGTGSSGKIHFFARYTGLAGRRLFSWAKPLLQLDLTETQRARTDSIDLALETTVGRVEEALEDVAETALRPLYERFDGFDPPRELFVSQVADLQRHIASARGSTRRR